MSGHEYITERLRQKCVETTPPEIRALLNEAATVIEGRDAALGQGTAARLLRGLVAHWNEFGWEHGFDELMDAADRHVRSTT